MKFEKAMNLFFGYLFAFLAVTSAYAVVTGAYHQIVNVIIGAVVSIAMFNKNRRICQK